MFPVEARQRSWNEKWFDRVGTSYLTGVAAGAVWGVYDGLRNAEGTSLRLRGNSLLNGLTRRGPYMGNTFAILGECTVIKYIIIVEHFRWVKFSSFQALPTHFFGLCLST